MHHSAQSRATIVQETRAVPDRHRPGPSRVRLWPDEVPVWTLVGYAMAVAERAQVGIDAADVICEVAYDYGISPAAVRVALDWYWRNPHAIDALLADNAARIV